MARCGDIPVYTAEDDLLADLTGFKLQRSWVLCAMRRPAAQNMAPVLQNAHRVAVLEEGMAYKAISLPPEDSQFLSTRQFGVNEICRIFRVPPHLVQDLEHATFSNIEHQSIDFVVHTLTPWLVRFEQAIVKDLLLESEQDAYFPKFNVDGLLRGDYQSRMRGYATGISNGFLSPNDCRRLENMNLIPAENGGDDYYLNGGYVRLEDAGKEEEMKKFWNWIHDDGGGRILRLEGPIDS